MQIRWASVSLIYEFLVIISAGIRDTTGRTLALRLTEKVRHWYHLPSQYSDSCQEIGLVIDGYESIIFEGHECEGRSETNDLLAVVDSGDPGRRGVWCGADVSCGCVRQGQDWRLKSVFVTGFLEDCGERKGYEEERG